MDDPRTIADGNPDWLTEAVLNALGVEPSVIARLPRRHASLDGRPCWHRDELPDLLRMAETGEGTP